LDESSHDARETTIDLWKERHAPPLEHGRVLISHASLAPPRSIRVIREEAREVVLPLYPDRPLLLGRDPKCSVVFASGDISREHARLWMREDGQWVIRDLGSRNGSALLRALPSHARPYDRGPLPVGEDTVVSAGDVVMLAGGANRVILDTWVVEADPARLSAQSAAARGLAEAVQICARHRLPVFLIGPSGSGKTHVARLIHEASGAKGQFILVNCGRLPTESVQLQSELLGHARGSFTGAVADRVGKFHAADGGSLFLDEVEYLPPAAQDFLIDLLDRSGSFAPLGAPATARWSPPDVRIVAASKSSLARSGLRADLCQRLAAADVIPLPTLDQRVDDIPALVQEFLHELGRQQGVRMEIEPEAVLLLQEASWPGQVRELEAAVKVTAAREYARHAAQGGAPDGMVITAAALRQHLENRRRGFGTPAPPTPKHAMGTIPGLAATSLHPILGSPGSKRPRDLTVQDIRDALVKHGGNKTRAAADLGIAVNTLKARMKSLGVTA
jgi:DNA-binding NtrC family response regulator